MLLKKVITLTLFVLLPLSLQAAGPVMHVVIAQRFFDTLSPKPDTKNQELFLVGTIFPDIRYLGVIKRHETHVKGPTLAVIRAESGSFRQGMLFHSWVDEFRQAYIRQVQIKQHLKDIPRRLQDIFLKAVEDQYLQSKYDVANMSTIMASIPDEAKQFDIELPALTQWHALLALYFSMQPSTMLVQLSLFDQGIMNLDPATVKLWSTLIPEYVKDPIFQNYVDQLMTAMTEKLREE